MSEDHLAGLLKKVVGDPPRTIDTKELVKRANRQRIRRALAVGAFAVVFIIAGFLGLGRLELGRIAVPTGGVTPSAAPSDAAATAQCPPLLPNTDNAAADYLDLFVWREATYVATDQRNADVETGDQVTTIGCSIAELTASNGNLVGPMPWPDRTSTFLPSGTRILSIKGVPPECRLVAQLKDGYRIYTAADLDSPDLRPRC